MTDRSTIKVPDLDSLDETARRGETVDTHQVTRLTAVVRRLVQLIIDSGGGHLIVKDGSHG